MLMLQGELLAHFALSNLLGSLGALFTQLGVLLPAQGNHEGYSLFQSPFSYLILIIMPHIKTIDPFNVA
jgi:hypothetical protein